MIPGLRTEESSAKMAEKRVKQCLTYLKQKLVSSKLNKSIERHSHPEKEEVQAVLARLSQYYAMDLPRRVSRQLMSCHSSSQARLTPMKRTDSPGRRYTPVPRIHPMEEE